jgi:glycolate oxidase
VQHPWLEALRRVVPYAQLVTTRGDRATYASDALTAYGASPAAVLLASSEQDVIDAVRICHRFGVPFVARGSGTSLSGGPVPQTDGLVIALNRLLRLTLDPARRLATAQPGVWNLDVSRMAAAHGLYYAPDPSSQQICSIGGNVAFNAGGAHCLKYGTTGNHVVGIRAVLPDATVVDLGGDSIETIGPGLTSLFTGSEGLLGIALRATLRLLPKPESVKTVLAAYPSLAAAGDAVAAVVAAGLLPAAIEVMDRLAVKAAEAAVHPGYPADAGGLLIVELDGETQQVDAEWELLDRVLAGSNPSSVRLARDERERAEIWKGRKSAFSAVGRLSPDFLVNDGVVPRTKLPVALTEIEALSSRYGLAVANVFHAGDGNLHPLILYDGRKAGELEHAEALSSEILDMCIRFGGSITGEHGVGLEKKAHLERLYSEADITAMRRIRLAVDPQELANRGKVLPTGPIAEQMGLRVEPAAATGPAPSPAPAPSHSLAPTTVEGVREAVLGSSRVLPRGGGTKTALSTPRRPDVAILDLSGLAGIVYYEPAEFVVSALAGTRITDIERLLAEHGQCLPFDPMLGEAGATIGGTVASGVSGPGRYRRGGVRDFVLGARFIDGQGNLVSGRGRVVKNVAGFDMPRLLAGSIGRLAVLTEVSLKVFPRPEAHETLVLRCSLEDALARVEALTLSRFDIDALDLVPDGDAALLFVRLAGSTPVLQARAERLRQHLGAGDLAPDEAEIWRSARELSWVPPGWTATVIPVTLPQVARLEALLRGTGSLRRYSSGGQVAWVASLEQPEVLGATLGAQGLSGLRVLGSPGAGVIVGRGVANELGRRVEQALDPAGRFVGA